MEPIEGQIFPAGLSVRMRENVTPHDHVINFSVEPFILDSVRASRFLYRIMFFIFVVR